MGSIPKGNALSYMWWHLQFVSQHLLMESELQNIVLAPTKKEIVELSVRLHKQATVLGMLMMGNSVVPAQDKEDALKDFPGFFASLEDMAVRTEKCEGLSAWKTALARYLRDASSALSVLENATRQENKCVKNHVARVWDALAQLGSVPRDSLHMLRSKCASTRGQLDDTIRELEETENDRMDDGDDDDDDDDDDDHGEGAAGTGADELRKEAAVVLHTMSTFARSIEATVSDRPDLDGHSSDYEPLYAVLEALEVTGDDLAGAALENDPKEWDRHEEIAMKIIAQGTSALVPLQSQQQ